MDQNAIRLVKWNYRSSLLREVVELQFRRRHRECTVYEAVYFITNASNILSSTTIKNCLNNILDSPELDEGDDIPPAQLFYHEQGSTATDKLRLIEGIFLNVRHSKF